MEVPRYLHDIPSLRKKYPQLPETIYGTRLDDELLAGAEADSGAPRRATTVADMLRSHCNARNPLITEEIVRSAALRAHAVTTANAGLECAPVDILHLLQTINNRLDTMTGELTDGLAGIRSDISKLDVTTKNSRIARRNQGRLLTEGYEPLLKTNEGDGVQLAVAAIPPGQHYQLVAPPNPPAIGSIPPNFVAHPLRMVHAQIYELIIFYNDNFGIIPTDTISQRMEKFAVFLRRDPA